MSSTASPPTDAYADADDSARAARIRKLWEDRDAAPTTPTPTCCDANAWIRKLSDTFYLQCTTRTVQESKLFPVNAYIALSYFNAFYRYPELLRKIDAAMPAEEIGDRAREVGSYVNMLTTGLHARSSTSAAASC